MAIRRQCDPINLKRIWNAIRSANQQKANADIAKINKYMQNIDDYSPGQVELFIKQAVNDKLVVPIKKGEIISINQIYKTPLEEELPSPDGKDWYCFECHLSGEVIECKNCFRVFHHDCISAARKKFDIQRKSMNFSIQKKPNSVVRTETATNFNPTQTTVTIIDDDDIGKNKNNSKTVDVDSSNILGQNVIDKSKLTYDESLCCICNIKRIDTSSDMDINEVNYLLKFVLNRIRAWLPPNITQTLDVEDTPDWLSEREVTWRANHLFCQHTDMSVIEVKLNTETYSMFADFYGDVLTTQHNVAIFHGTDSQEYGAAELMVRDTNYDITEMRNCVDCYKHSNEKINPRWFCLPCRVPHVLVWAKQKGYPYWPAKVIKETSTQFDVRFFGGKYERALLQKMYVKPIDTPKDVLMIKATTAFNKAFDELRYHQKLLNNPSELEQLVAESKLFKKKPLSKTSLPISAPIKSPRKSIDKQNQNHMTASTSKSRRSISQEPEYSSLSLGPNKRKIIEPENKCFPVEDTGEKRRKAETDTNSSFPVNNVINISDGEEEDCPEYSYRQNRTADSIQLDDSYEQVTSSTENFGKLLSPRSESGMQPLDQPYSDSVEKMRRKLECLGTKTDIIKSAMDCMQIEIDRITNDHNEHLKRLFESHNQQISETKKKQWCYNCEQDAIYHCCWNTAYCSQTCQQHHWQIEHKKVCRRKQK